MGSVIQWGGFDSARVLTLPYFHIARCVVYSMQACKDGTLGSPQLVVHLLTTDSHSDATPEMVWRRLWRTFSSGDRVKLAVRD
jgi:hypothetical protein